MNPIYLTSFGLIGLAFVLLALTFALSLSPVGRALPLAVEKAVMPMCAMALIFIGNLFRIAARGVGEIYSWWEPYVNLGAAVMFLLVIFFTAFASARKQIKASEAILKSAA